MSAVKLICSCCNFEQEFSDPEEAFNKGWDAPPHFTTGYISCNLCPISFLYGIDHSPIHKKWEENGRPKEFTQETCVVEDQRVPQEKLNALIEELNMLKKELPNNAN